MLSEAEMHIVGVEKPAEICLSACHLHLREHGMHSTQECLENLPRIEELAGKAGGGRRMTLIIPVHALDGGAGLLYCGESQDALASRKVIVESALQPVERIDDLVLPDGADVAIDLPMPTPVECSGVQ
jgi:hypothetical protein